MSSFIPKRRSRGEWIAPFMDGFRSAVRIALYLWIVLGWLLVVPAFFYFMTKGPL